MKEDVFVMAAIHADTLLIAAVVVFVIGLTWLHYWPATEKPPKPQEKPKEHL